MYLTYNVGQQHASWREVLSRRSPSFFEWKRPTHTGPPPFFEARKRPTFLAPLNLPQTAIALNYSLVLVDMYNSLDDLNHRISTEERYLAMSTTFLFFLLFKSCIFYIFVLKRITGSKCAHVHVQWSKTYPYWENGLSPGVSVLRKFILFYSDHPSKSSLKEG